jgi:hypothetical protein
MSALTQERSDLHNLTIDLAAAAERLCGFTHLPSGRVCRLPYRHPGPCDLRSRPPSSSTRENDHPLGTASSRQLNPKGPQ